MAKPSAKKTADDWRHSDNSFQSEPRTVVVPSVMTAYQNTKQNSTLS